MTFDASNSISYCNILQHFDKGKLHLCTERNSDFCPFASEMAWKIKPPLHMTHDDGMYLNWLNIQRIHALIILGACHMEHVLITEVSFAPTQNSLTCNFVGWTCLVVNGSIDFLILISHPHFQTSSSMHPHHTLVYLV